MKRAKRKRIVELLLVLVAIQIALIRVGVNGTVRGQSASNQLVGTKWKLTVDVGQVNPLDFDLMEATHVLNGTVELAIIHHIYGYEYRRQYNPITGGYDQPANIPTPSALKRSDPETLECSYNQTGKSIHIKCISWDIDAAIQGNHIEGEINFTGLGRRKKCVFERYEETPKAERHQGIDYLSMLDESKADPNDKSVHPNVVRNSSGTLRPADGYQWSDPTNPKDLRVERIPGLTNTADGHLQPDKGYRWVNPKDPKDFRVERIP